MNRLALNLAVLMILAVIAHLPALQNGFIWDDDDHFTQNPAMTRPEGLRKIWSSLTVSRYYPLTLTTFWVQRRLWGLDPLPYHAVNIALHALNAVLLFVLLRRLKVRGAWVAAALWGVHPVNVESVAWATELKNVQSGLFFFASLLCFLQFECRSVLPGATGSSTRGRVWYALSLSCFAAALLSKPSTVVLPAVLLLFAWWQRRAVDWRRVGPFFTLSAVMAVLTILEQHGHIERAPQDWSLALTARLILAGKALWFYAGKLIWPANLMFVYPRWRLDPDSLPSLLPLAGVVAVGVVVWWYRRRGWARAAAFGLGYFVIALLTVLGFFDIFYFRYSFVADHFQYLAGVGILALAAAGMQALVRGRSGRIAVTTVALAGLSALSWRHILVFRDNETLWRDTLARNPNAFIAHNNLGLILNRAGQHEQAAEHFRQALAIKPDYLEAHTSLGSSLIELGRYTGAEQELQAALRIKPDYSKAHYALGKLCHRLNRLEQAKQNYALAVRSEPGLAAAHYDLGCIWLQQGQRERAVACFENALLVRPSYPEAHNNLGNLLAQRGQLQEAVEHYRIALCIAPDFGQAHYNLGLRLRELHRFDEAIQHFQQAVRLMPSLPDSRIELAGAYAEAGRFDEAAAAARHAITLATARGQTNLTVAITERLVQYEAHQPDRLP